MKKLGDEGFTWTEAKIDKWIADPKAMIADSPMALAFQGVPMPPNGPTSSPI
jgi:cytochrome c2